MQTIPSAPRRPARPGFTLIELLVVIVVLGVIAAIAIPKFRSTQQRTSRGAGVADLRNLIAAQESYHQEHGAYTIDLNDLDFRGSAGTVVTVIEGTAEGWSAQATRAGVPGRCAIHSGTAAPVLAGAAASQVSCVD